MQDIREPSIEGLRKESERPRQDLASTVGDLRDKVGDTATELKTLVSPSHIKQEIKNYVREERESSFERAGRSWRCVRPVRSSSGDLPIGGP